MLARFHVDSLIMEGFNEAAVREFAKIPKRSESPYCVSFRYQIASIVSLGYKAKNAVVYDTPRFAAGIVLAVLVSSRENDLRWAIWKASVVCLF